MFPYAFDDYTYMGFLGIDENGLPDSIDWGNFYDCFIHNKQSDNLRLANMSAVFALAAPKWIIGLASAVLFSFSIILGGKTVGFTKNNGVAISILSALLILVLPWWEGIVAVDYQLNYIWATALFALDIWLFLRDRHLQWFMGAILGLLLGIWHEGFSAPALIAMIFVAAVWKRFRNPGRLAMIFGIGLGTAFLLWVPGMRLRFANHPDSISYYDVSRTILALSPIAVFFLLSIISWLSGKRDIIKSPVWTMLSIICIVSGTMKFLQDDFRVCWAGLFTACIGCVWLAGILTRRINQAYKLTAGSASLLLIVLNLTFADIESFRERNVVRQVIEAIRNGKETLYVNGLKTFNNAPLLAWGKPLQTMWRWPAFESYYNLSSGSVDRLALVPDELESFNPQDARIMPGGWWQTTEGWIVKRHDNRIDAMYMKVKTPLADENVWVKIITFRSKADGELYDFVLPTMAPPWVRPIKDIVEIRP